MNRPLMMLVLMLPLTCAMIATPRALFASDVDGCPPRSPALELARTSAFIKAQWRLIHDHGIHWRTARERIYEVLDFGKISTLSDLTEGVRLRIHLPDEAVTLDLGLHYDLDFSEVRVWFLDGRNVEDKRPCEGTLSEDAKRFVIEVKSNEYEFVPRDYFDRNR